MNYDTDELINKIHARPDDWLFDELKRVWTHNARGHDEVDAEYYWLIYDEILARLPDYHQPCARCGTPLHSKHKRGTFYNTMCASCAPYSEILRARFKRESDDEDKSDPETD